MNEARLKLIEAAKAVHGAFRLREDFSAGSVGAAILTAKGNIYTGICIDLACGLGFCAEVAAVAEMLKARETHIWQLLLCPLEGFWALRAGGAVRRWHRLTIKISIVRLSWATVGKFLSGTSSRNIG
jgi:hypothetical protein